MILLFLSACHPVDPSTYGEGPCAEASARVGARVCVHEVPDLETWDGITVDARAADQDRATRHMVPVADDDPLPALFADANTYDLHYDMLSQAFPDLFPGLSFEDYVAMVVEPDVRSYYSGDVATWIGAGGALTYGFTVWDDPARIETTITQADATRVWEQLQPHFAIGELVFVPNSSNQRDAAATWTDPPFTIRGESSDIDYEVYTQATGYGTVRRLTLTELAAATEAASFGYQDLLVLDEAPLDIERVIAGSVTGSRQGALSHLNVRAAARGTPNCYVADALEALAPWDGQLVALTCGAEDWSVVPATQAEAEAWWASIRPDPVEIPTPDLLTTDFVGLLDLPTDTAAARAAAVATYGSKGANLGILYQRIPATYQLDGFLVPFAWYDQFMRDNTWLWEVDGVPTPLSFAETLDRWLADDRFRTDAAVRRADLEALRGAMTEATVDPVLLGALSDTIEAVWGSDAVAVRFRSSSNAEDALAFSGAGLYDSRTACVADEWDVDTVGPSACDPEEADEEDLSRALTEVWASLWNMEAYEERDWYGIDHTQVAMGILVDTRIDGEEANMVAFTGNPTAVDDRFLVEAQVGAYDVVAAEAGITPERDLLTMAGGAVVDILRADGSSELPEGSWVLTDGELGELGAVLWDVREVFPVDAEAPPDTTILLDTEWKLLDDGGLVIKQVRPFLREDAALGG